MSTLNLFPIRVPIGTVKDSSGQERDVLMTPEFSRALSALLNRVGGSDGTSSADIEALAIEALMPSPVIQPDVFPAADTIALAQEVAALRRQVQGLAQQLATASPATAKQDDAMAYAMFGTQSAQVMNWARPGKIGSAVPNSGAFTTLRASGQITSTVSVGTPPLVVTSTTNVPNLNASSLNGATFASPGAIGGTAQNTVLGSAFKCPFGGTLLGLSVSSYLVQPELASLVRSYSVGQNAGTYGSYEHYAATSTPVVQLVYTATNVGFKVALAFGCNGAAPQTAFALGGAAVDLPTVIALANNLRTMAINNGIGS